MAKLVPVLIGGNSIPQRISNRVWADFTSRDSMKKNFRNLVWKLSRPNQGLDWQSARRNIENERVSIETSQVNFERINEEFLNDNSNYLTIKAPMVGTIYRSAAPERPPFIKIGDMVDIGSRVCIIEAMKLFNEIESDVKGKITKILVEDASPVEYDQPLFLVAPI